MSDLNTTIQSVLESAEYKTQHIVIAGTPALNFEDSVIVGFVFVFPTAADMIATWRQVELTILKQFSSHLRDAGDKAWNVYLVLLTSQHGSSIETREVHQIEEDLERSRKLAACSVATRDDVIQALWPILPIQFQPVLAPTDFEERLRRRIAAITPKAATAFLNPDVPPSEVVSLLGIAR